MHSHRITSLTEKAFDFRFWRLFLIVSILIILCWLKFQTSIPANDVVCALQQNEPPRTAELTLSKKLRDPEQFAIALFDSYLNLDRCVAQGPHRTAQSGPVHNCLSHVSRYSGLFPHYPTRDHRVNTSHVGYVPWMRLPTGQDEVNTISFLVALANPLLRDPGKLISNTRLFTMPVPPPTLLLHTS